MRHYLLTPEAFAAALFSASGWKPFNERSGLKATAGSSGSAAGVTMVGFTPVEESKVAFPHSLPAVPKHFAVGWIGSHCSV